MRALIYARVSYDDRKNEDRNLEGQIEDGQVYCQEKGYSIVAELAEDDRGASGADWDLPMLSQALDMARAGECDVLVTRELDRFARGLAKQLVVESEFKRQGVEVEYILGEYPDTPEGQLNKNIRAVIAEFEREKINQRMTRGRRRIVKAGKVMLHGNKPPYGYRVEGRILVTYEPEARIVRLIFAWYIYGDEHGKKLSIRAIANRLTEMRVPTWGDTHNNPFGKKKRRQGEWNRNTVRKILTNETYAGVWYYSKRRDAGRKANPREQWLAVEVPGIVSRELWEKAQERRKRNKELATRNTKHNYLIGRRVVCGQCGGKMAGKSVSKKYLYYYCPKSQGELATNGCDSRLFRADQVDNAVWEWVKGLLLNPEALRQDLEEQRAEQELVNQPLWDRLAVFDDLLTQKRAERERCFQAYISGKWDEDVALREKAQLDKTIGSLERERADLLATLKTETLSDAQITTLTDFAEEVSEGLEVADEDFEARRQIIDLLDVQVTLVREEEQEIAYVRCLVDETGLSIESATSESDV